MHVRFQAARPEVAPTIYVSTWHKADIFGTAAERLFSVVNQTKSAGRSHGRF